MFEVEEHQKGKGATGVFITAETFAVARERAKVISRLAGPDFDYVIKYDGREVAIYHGGKRL